MNLAKVRSHGFGHSLDSLVEYGTQAAFVPATAIVTRPDGRGVAARKTTKSGRLIQVKLWQQPLSAFALPRPNTNSLHAHRGRRGRRGSSPTASPSAVARISLRRLRGACRTFP